MTYREKIVELYERYLRAHFDATFDNDANAKRVEQMFNSDSLSQIIPSHNQFAKVNKFVSAMVAEICRTVLDDKLEEVVKLIVSEIRVVIDELISEDEAKTLYEFATTELAQKLLRNIDLLKDAFFKGSLEMTTEIVAQWSRPEVAESIMAYIASLDSDEDEV